MPSRSCSSVPRADRLRYGRTIAIGCLVALCLVCTHSRVVAQNSDGAPKSRRKVLVTVQPQYPAVLREGRYQGQVRIAATVLPNGSVSRVQTLGGNPMFSEFAEAAVKKWKYAPGPVETVEEVTFNFNPGNQ